MVPPKLGTAGFFKVGDGVAHIDDIRVVTPINRFSKRYVSFSVRYWADGVIDGPGTLYERDLVTTWTFTLPKDRYAPEALQGFCVNVFLTTFATDNQADAQAALLKRRDERSLVRRWTFWPRPDTCVVLNLNQLVHQEHWRINDNWTWVQSGANLTIDARVHDASTNGVQRADIKALTFFHQPFLQFSSKGRVLETARALLHDRLVMRID